MNNINKFLLELRSGGNYTKEGAVIIRWQSVDCETISKVFSTSINYLIG